MNLDDFPFYELVKKGKDPETLINNMLIFVVRGRESDDDCRIKEYALVEKILEAYDELGILDFSNITASSGLFVSQDGYALYYFDEKNNTQLEFCVSDIITLKRSLRLS